MASLNVTWQGSEVEIRLVGDDLSNFVAFLLTHTKNTTYYVLRTTTYYVLTSMGNVYHCETTTRTTTSNFPFGLVEGARGDGEQLYESFVPAIKGLLARGTATTTAAADANATQPPGGCRRCSFQTERHRRERASRRLLLGPDGTRRHAHYREPGSRERPTHTMKHTKSAKYLATANFSESLLLLAAPTGATATDATPKGATKGVGDNSAATALSGGNISVSAVSVSAAASSPVQSSELENFLSATTIAVEISPLSLSLPVEARTTPHRLDDDGHLRV